MKDLSVDKNVLTYLQEFGLNDKEIVIYLSLLKYGPNTIMDLARKTGIKRSTTHNNVEELIKKGLVSQTNYGERRMVIAEDPDKLKFLLEQRKWEVSKLERNMDGIVEEIYNSIPKAKENTNVEVKYYNELKDIRSVYEETLTANEVYSYVNLDKYYEIFPDPIGLQQKALKSNIKREVYDIVVDTPKAREVKKKDLKRYQVKFISSEDRSTGFDFLIFNNRVAMIQLDIEKPLAILIYSVNLAEALKSFHKTIWKLLPEK